MELNGLRKEVERLLNNNSKLRASQEELRQRTIEEMIEKNEKRKEILRAGQLTDHFQSRTPLGMLKGYFAGRKEVIPVDRDLLWEVGCF